MRCARGHGMTETWVPDVGQHLRVLDNSYSSCSERALIGQIGVVQSIQDLPADHVLARRHHILVIQFKAIAGNNPTSGVNGVKTHFNEYFDLSRGAYLYFQPVTIGTPPVRSSRSGNRGGK